MKSWEHRQYEEDRANIQRGIPFWLRSWFKSDSGVYGDAFSDMPEGYCPSATVYSQTLDGRLDLRGLSRFDYRMK